MDFNKLIQDQIQTATTNAVADILPSVIDDILQQLNKPEYTTWGRFFSTEQACKYLGIKSTNGLKSFLCQKGIKPVNKQKPIKYDRHDLDRINSSAAIANYLTQLK